MTRILIVEDISTVANRLKKNIERLGYVCVGIAPDLKTARSILQNNSPDVAIIDIDLNGIENGLDLAPELEKRDTPFIVLSDLKNKAIRDQVFKHPPAAYLIKPITLENLQSTVELVMVSKSKTASSCSFHFKQRNGFTKLIDFNDIVYLKADHGGREIHFLENSKMTRVVDKGTLSNFINIHGGSNFQQVHRAFVVNTNYIDSFTYTEIKLKPVTDVIIPIGKSYHQTISSLLGAR